MTVLAVSPEAENTRGERSGLGVKLTHLLSQRVSSRSFPTGPEGWDLEGGKVELWVWKGMAREAPDEASGWGPGRGWPFLA